MLAKKAKGSKGSRKKQMQELLDDSEKEEEKENSAPGLFIQGALTGPLLSLGIYNVSLQILSLAPPTPTKNKNMLLGHHRNLKVPRDP